MIKLETPLNKDSILELNVGDWILLNGIIFTARDKAHRYLLENDFENIRGSVIYHCGPIVKNNDVIAAGPTTSSRMNAYTPKLIEKYGIKAIIGKGGMDKQVLNSINGKAVYFSAIGGAALIYAKSAVVRNVYKMEFGMPEAIWELEVKDFPLIVAMDSKGNSLYENVARKSKDVFQRLMS